MKDKIAIACILLTGVAVSFMQSCSNSDQAITNAVQTAVSQAISHVPAEFQTTLANYIEVGAKGVYSIDGTPTVQELTNKVIAFIPKDVQDKYPLITTTITTAVSLAYVTYGKSGLTAIGKGLEAGAAPYITHPGISLKRIQTDAKVTFPSNVAFCWYCSCWTVEEEGNTEGRSEHLKQIAANF